MSRPCAIGWRRSSPNSVTSTVLGKDAPRLPNTACVAVAGKSSETLVMALDLAGYAISAGSACSSGKVKPSHVALAMGYGEEIAKSAIRISLGWWNNEAEIDGLVARLAHLAGRKVHTFAGHATGSLKRRCAVR